MTHTITPEEISTLRDLADDSGDMEWRRWADALADKIEAMQDENAALKKRIEESARTFAWYLDEAGIWCLHAFGAMASIYPNGEKWYWSVVGDVSRGGIVDTLEIAFAEAYKTLREGGRVRPIDTVIGPEGMR